MELVVRQLRRRVGPVPDILTARLDPLTASQLDDLGEALLDFRTAADLQQWLDQHQRTNVQVAPGYQRP